jgi:glutamyl-Q tRNA(Asp) synthetase
MAAADKSSAIPTPAYRGRFAPSPTGPLHFGSLVAAVGSYLDARAHRGTWQLRIEDLDKPREVPGAKRQIVNALKDFGFAWDGAIEYQSKRDAAYRQAFERLQKTGLVYPCACSRREIADSALNLSSLAARSMIYPGTCRNGLAAGKTPRAWRIRVPNESIVFEDRECGRVMQNLARDTGDFVLLRADGQWAYQLAVVVDDAAAGITDVVRGADLLDSTPRQIFLQRCLGLPIPRYMHLPVALNEKGEKLSKQTGARPIAPSDSNQLLRLAFDFLGLPDSGKLTLTSAVAAWKTRIREA